MRKLSTRLARNRTRPVDIIPRSTEDVVAAKARRHNVRLLPEEIKKVANWVDEISDGDWRQRQRKLKMHFRKTRDAEAEKQMLLEVALKIYEGTVGLRILQLLEISTVVLFALVGTQIAGQAGMHVLGTTFVGVISSVGGASLNNVLLGDIRGGVFWIRDVRWLALSVGTSVATFYCWPQYEAWAAESEMQQMRCAAHVETGSSITFEQFTKALEEDPYLAQHIRSTVSKAKGCRTHDLADAKGVESMFYWLDKAKTGVLESSDLQNLARLHVMQSPVMYGIESILTGTAGISGAMLGINQGKTPAICIVLGVSNGFGGILRDLICGRDVALGTSSFALASMCSAVSFVFLRELSVRGIPIPLFLRVILSVSAGVCQRAWCWLYLEPGDHYLSPMANYRPCE